MSTPLLHGEAIGAYLVHSDEATLGPGEKIVRGLFEVFTLLYRDLVGGLCKVWGV